MKTRLMTASMSLVWLGAAGWVRLVGCGWLGAAVWVNGCGANSGLPGAQVSPTATAWRTSIITPSDDN